MSKNQKHIFSAKEIQRYHNGDMSSVERHAMEKAALEDPFLADAIEGYAYTASADADLVELKTKLDKKQQKEKTIPIYSLNAKWLRVAALFLLLAGCGWLIFEVGMNNNHNDLALTKKEDTINNASPSNADTQTKNVKTESDTISSLSNEVAQASPPKESVTRKNKSLPKQINNQNTIAANKYSGLKEKKPATIDTKTEMSSEESAESAMDIADIVSAHEAKKVIRGQVINTKGAPLPFAIITDQNNRIATTTDVNGKFTIPVTDTIINATIAAIGYQKGLLNLNADNRNEQKIVLTEADASLQEVVVTGMAANKRRKAVVPSPVLEKSGLNPVKGWEHFNEYVAKNLKRPEEENNLKVTGEVWLVFSIDKNGKPINIQLEKSLCVACDREAIRLLEEGPVWKGQRGKSGKVRIIF